MENRMTAAQQLAKQMMEKKNGSGINWDELKFKIESNKPVYLRFVPDANEENGVFFLDYKTYKLSDTVYVNYPDGKNIIQKTLNALYSGGDAAGKALYSQYRGRDGHNVGIVLCDANGVPQSNKAKIWSITSKKAWDTIMSLFFTEDFIDAGTTYFKVTRVGEKLETQYRFEQFDGKKLDYSTIQLAKLDLPLAFAKSDTKALPILQKLNRQFDLGMSFSTPPVTVPTASHDDDDLDDFDRQILKDIEED